VKGDNGDLHANSHNILSSLKDYYWQLLIVRGVTDDRWTEIRAAETLIGLPDSDSFEVEIAV
jgi:hypothetical protein